GRCRAWAHRDRRIIGQQIQPLDVARCVLGARRCSPERKRCAGKQDQTTHGNSPTAECDCLRNRSPTPEPFSSQSRGGGASPTHFCDLPAQGEWPTSCGAGKSSRKLK